MDYSFHRLGLGRLGWGECRREDRRLGLGRGLAMMRLKRGRLRLRTFARMPWYCVSFVDHPFCRTAVGFVRSRAETVRCGERGLIGAQFSVDGGQQRIVRLESGGRNRETGVELRRVVPIGRAPSS